MMADGIETAADKRRQVTGDRDDLAFIRAAFDQLNAGRSLSEASAVRMMGHILDGIVARDQLINYLTLLSAKGASAGELIGSAKALRASTSRLPVSFDVIDTCGTGGDRSATFNISTVAALVVAAAGQPVAKHGNRSSSGGVGSADLLESLGLDINLDHDRLLASLQQRKFAFLFAPRFRSNSALIAEARRQVRGPTIFNLVGPLCNPSGPAFQVIGTVSERIAVTMAEAALHLGTRRSFIVAGPEGIDELIPADGNIAFEVSEGRITRHVLRPSHAGVRTYSPDALRGGGVRFNAGLALRILSGRRGAPRDAVMMNGGLALVAAGRAESLREGCEQCASAIDGGAAADLLSALRSEAGGREPNG